MLPIALCDVSASCEVAEGKMKIIDEALLQEFRCKEVCELCGRRTRQGLDPCHYLARGMGSGRRLDVRINLVAACRDCHNKQHSGQLPRRRLLEVIAAREKRTAEAIEAELWALVALPKGGGPSSGKS